jgi:16S rRNA (cytosine967-C5)-methyltransferase
LRIAESILAEYDFRQPFHLWLKDVFRKHPQFGSKDRKFYKEAFYSYWRLGNWGKTLSLSQKLAFGLLRTNSNLEGLTPVVQSYFPNKTGAFSFHDVCDLLSEEWSPYSHFSHLLSQNFGIAELNNWFGKAAPVWLKTWPQKRDDLLLFLNRQQISYQEPYPCSFSINSGNIDLAVSQGLCIIQDIGSQQCLQEKDFQNAELIWDACCGAGGKSISIVNLAPKATLYISDIRSKMVDNAIERFNQLHWALPISGVNDISSPQSSITFNEKMRIPKPVFDVVVCDVPCSGSGTWRRNPESLTAFDSYTMEDYVARQQQIVANAQYFLKNGGKLIYLTCSVFEKENENNMDFFTRQLNLKPISSGYSGGAETDGDYLFKAVLEKTIN